MELGLKGRAAVIAGGTRGVGRATAELLAAEGCRVAVLARTPSHLREAEDELFAAGAEDAIGLECNLLDSGEVEAAFEFLDERWGELHALVNTVGPAQVGGGDGHRGRPWPRAMIIRCTSEVPSPISRILASRYWRATRVSSMKP